MVILHCQNVAESTAIFLAHTVSKLAFTHDKFVANTVVEEKLPLTARSLLAVG